jgi:hypothetical protein
MEIHSVVQELLHADRWFDMVKLIGAFLQLFIVNMPETDENECKWKKLMGLM